MTITELRKGFLNKLIKERKNALEMYTEFLSEEEIITIAEDGSIFDNEPALMGSESSLDLMKEELIILIVDGLMMEFLVEYDLTKEYLDYAQEMAVKHG